MDGGRWKGYIEQKKKVRELILKKEKKKKKKETIGNKMNMC